MRNAFILAAIPIAMTAALSTVMVLDCLRYAGKPFSKFGFPNPDNADAVVFGLLAILLWLCTCALIKHQATNEKRTS